MAITKRLVHVKKNTTTYGTLKTEGNDYAQSIAFYAGEVPAEADILTHGESYVQAPLDAREVVISGVNAGKIAETTIASIGTYNSSTTTGEGENLVTTHNPQAVAEDGITLNNLNKLIGDLNDYVLKTNEEADANNAVTLEKLGSTGDAAGWAAVYQLKQGGKSITPTINIPKDLFLKLAFYAEKTADITGKSLTEPSGTTYPCLVFEWQYTDDTGDTEGHAVSTVPVDELVDVYTGATNASTAAHKKCTSSIDTTTENTTYTVTTTIADADSTDLPAGTTPTGTASGVGGKVIVTTLDNNIKSALAKAESAEAYTNVSVSELANAIGVSKNTNAVTYSGTAANKVLNEYRTIDKTSTDSNGKTIYKSKYSESGDDIIKTDNPTVGTSQLGNNTGQISVATALTELTKAVLGNQDDIIRLYENSDSVQDALEDALDTIEVNGRQFIKDTNDSNKLKSTVEAGDIKLKYYRNAEGLPEENSTTDGALISKDVTVSGSTFAAVYTDGLAITNSDTIYNAFSKLEQMWLWAEL